MRKQFPGAAQPVRTTVAINSSATSVTIDSTAGWPTGPLPWVITFNRGMANEEQVLCRSRTGSTLSWTAPDRGYGDTLAVAHEINETVECSIDPVTVDEANRLANLATAKGEIFVHDGANIMVLSAPATGQMLVGNSAAAKGVEWISRWIPIASSPPAITEPNGQQYFDSNRLELFTSYAGSWESAALGVVVFDNAGQRDALFGSNGPIGRLAYLADEDRLYVGTQTSWQALGVPGEFAVTFPDVATRDASSLGAGSLSVVNNQLFLKRPSAWYPVGVHFHGVPAPPEEDVEDGDYWSQPV